MKTKITTFGDSKKEKTQGTLAKTLITLVLALSLAVVALGCSSGEAPAGDNNQAANESSTPAAETDTGAAGSQTWQEFLDEYDVWSGKYIETIKELLADPTNEDLLKESGVFAEQASEWAEKIRDFRKNLPEEEIAEFQEKCDAIGKRIEEALQGITEG